MTLLYIRDKERNHARSINQSKFRLCHHRR